MYKRSEECQEVLNILEDMNSGTTVYNTLGFSFNTNHFKVCTMLWHLYKHFCSRVACEYFGAYGTRSRIVHLVGFWGGPIFEAGVGHLNPGPPGQ